MKKFILFLLLLVLILAGFTAFLLRNDFEKISENRDAFAGTLRHRVDEVVFTYAPRAVRLFLFKNMPGIFPVVFVCETVPAAGEKQSLFSGDIVAATGEDARFYCPGQLEVTVRPGGQVRLLPKSGTPSLQLIQGQVNLSFRENPPSIQSDFFSFTFQGQPAGNRMNLAVSHDGFSIGCMNGAIKGKLETSPATEGKKNFLLARDCLFSLKWSPTMPEKHFMPGDVVAFSDLEKSRKDWAPQDLSSRLSELGVDPMANPSIMARIDPVPTSGDTVKLAWQSSAPSEPYTCTLYTQENTRAPAQAAHRFQGDPSAGELVLLKGFLKFWISISCNNGVQSFTSNILPPM